MPGADDPWSERRSGEGCQLGASGVALPTLTRKLTNEEGPLSQPLLLPHGEPLCRGSRSALATRWGAERGTRQEHQARAVGGTGWESQADIYLAPPDNKRRPDAQYAEPPSAAKERTDEITCEATAASARRARLFPPAAPRLR
jgi:hypothetical protein